MYNDDNSSIPCSVDTSYESTVVSNSASSINSKKKRNKKEEAKPSIYFIYQQIDKNKKKKINIFNSSIQINSHIINATTGFPCVDDNMKYYTVGSKEEDLFFKVKFVSGENNIPGITLFYDSPEQYERHMNVTLSELTKVKYYEKRNDFIRKNVLKKIISQ